jgi:hypothetical protein
LPENRSQHARFHNRRKNVCMNLISWATDHVEMNEITQGSGQLVLHRVTIGFVPKRNGDVGNKLAASPIWGAVCQRGWKVELRAVRSSVSVLSYRFNIHHNFIDKTDGGYLH